LVSKKIDTLIDICNVYFSEVPYAGGHKLEKDPVYTIQHRGEPPRFRLRWLNY
jgi:hypothetical protein